MVVVFSVMVLTFLLSLYTSYPSAVLLILNEIFVFVAVVVMVAVGNFFQTAYKVVGFVGIYSSPPSPTIVVPFFSSDHPLR